MKNENIIKTEAAICYNRLVGSTDERLSQIKIKLEDFYSPEFKSIFLNQIIVEIEADLENHRYQAHDGEAKSDCDYEKEAEALEFYITQELGTLPAIANLKRDQSTEFERNKVFISYSHLDKEYLADIKRHFKPFLKEIDYWDDTKILPGQKWKDEIQKAINGTKVAILLVSTDFLGSDFISSQELPPLLKAAEEDGAYVLVVILKPCLFEEFPEINQYQALNPPNKPVLKMNYDEKEDLWVNLVRQTKRILKE